MAGHTSQKKRRSTCAMRGSRWGGASSSAAAGRRANSMKLTPPSQAMAARTWRNFIRACMADILSRMRGTTMEWQPKTPIVDHPATPLAGRVNRP